MQQPIRSSVSRLRATAVLLDVLQKQRWPPRFTKCSLDGLLVLELLLCPDFLPSEFAKKEHLVYESILESGYI